MLKIFNIQTLIHKLSLNKICFCFFLAVLLVFSPVFAEANKQKIYTIDSDVYKELCFLYILEGRAIPSSAGPWSQDELIRMLNTVSPGGELYSKVYNTLNEENSTKPKTEQSEIIKTTETTEEEFPLIMDFKFSGSVEAAGHTNTSTWFTGYDNWGNSFNQRKQLLLGQFDFKALSWFYFRTDLQVGIVKHQETPFGSNHFMTNIPGITSNALNEIDINMPYTAFISAGGNHWSFELGRDKLNWGNAVTSNFMADGHLRYHNMLRFTTYYDTFKYTFVSSFFPHPINYYSYNEDTDSWFLDPYKGQAVPVNGISMFMAHRLEFRLLQDKLNLSISEGIMFMSETGWLDLSILNPAYVFHDAFIRGNSNSLLTVEVDWTVLPGWNIYTQIGLDEFAFFNEPSVNSGKAANPNGVAALLGTKVVFPYKSGYFHASLEGVYTDPYLYLRDNGSYTQNKGEYGISWVVALREMCSQPSGYYEEFLGFKYGGDAIVANLNGGYIKPGKWKVEGNLFFMVHGTFDRWTCWTQVGGSTGIDYNATPTTTHPTPNNKDELASNRDAVSYTWDAGLYGSFDATENLSLYTQLDAVFLINPGNLSVNATESDLQITAGVSWKL